MQTFNLFISAQLVATYPEAVRKATHLPSSVTHTHPFQKQKPFYCLPLCQCISKQVFFAWCAVENLYEQLVPRLLVQVSLIAAEPLCQGHPRGTGVALELNYKLRAPATLTTVCGRPTSVSHTDQLNRALGILRL